MSADAHAAAGPAPRRAEPRRPRPDGPGWLADLERELGAHRAVRHPLLARFASGAASRRDALAFGLQHHALVGVFPRYMELLLLAAPSAREKLWLAKVLVDEYGEGSDGRDHPALYAEFLAAAGADAERPWRVPLCRAAWEFVDLHLHLCRREPYLVGLGALGPGHEWSIPPMFHQLVPGLARAGLGRDERLYFDLHTEQDLDHGAWMSEVLAALVTGDAERALVRAGALRSLDARARLWDAVHALLDADAAPAAAADAALPAPSDSPGDLRALHARVAEVISGRRPDLGLG